MNTLFIHKANLRLLNGQLAKLTKFFRTTCNDQNELKQLISFSYIACNILLIAIILSLSDWCTIVASESIQPYNDYHHHSNASNISMTSAPSLLTKLNAFDNKTLASSTETSESFASNIVGDNNNNALEIFSFFSSKNHINVKFLNISGKIGTSLSIGK